MIRRVHCDGSPDAAAKLAGALAEALDGGPAVVPFDTPPGPGVAAPPDGTALLIQTSGSTGNAKQVILTARALRASAGAAHARLGGPGRWLLALPAHHIAGAQVVVRGLLSGHPPIVLDSRGGFRTDRFTAAATAVLSTEGRHYTALVPTQLHRLLAAGGPALDALRGFDGVLVGGAATAPTLLTRARAAQVQVRATYGMSETAGGCVYDGVPLDGVGVRLDQSSGRISLTGPVLASGYLNQPQLTARTFSNGWFHTSDLGQWAEDGGLQVLGRADDVITTGGEKVHPGEVERILTSQQGVRAACVVGLPDPEWGHVVAAALVLDAQTTPHRLGDAVRVELGSPSVPRIVRVLGELPVRGIGKPDRARIAHILDEVRR